MFAETRNSSIRQYLAFIPESTARTVHRILPNLSPNHVTLASSLATLYVGIQAGRRNINGEVDFAHSRGELVVLALAQGLDFFDGSLAREIKKVGDREHDSRLGGMLDSLNDRWGALVMGVSRMASANRRGDRYGEFVARLATLTNPWPSYLRAEGEANLKVFPESGKNPLEFFGTHAGRTLLAIPATLYPSLKLEVFGKKFTLQNVTDTITTISNVVTMVQRIRGGTPIEEPDFRLEEDRYNEKMEEIYKIRDDAEFREKGLLMAALGTTAAVLATHFILHRRK